MWLERNKYKIYVIVFLLFLGFLLFNIIQSVIDSKNDKNENRSTIPNDIALMTYAQTIIKDYLKSPSSAKFPTQVQNYTIINTLLRYKVTSTVEAENSFGAMIKSDFTVIFEFEDYNYEAYEAVEVWIDDVQYK